MNSIFTPYFTQLSLTASSKKGSCLKTGQHFIFVILYLLLLIKYIFFDALSKILFNFFMYKQQKFDLILIIIMEILFHNVYKIVNK